MKKQIVLIIILIVMSCENIFSQVPESINYQAVLRNNTGELLNNQNVTIRISIIEGSAGGTVVYREQQSKITNNFGVVEIQIGNGTSDIGTFSLINWGILTKFIKIEINTGSGFINMGTSQLITVPYSMYSKKAKTIDNEVLYFTESDTLFAVKDREGNVVFAVFPDGAKVYVNEQSKASVGGFAVSGRSPTKETEYNIFQVSPDSTVIYINNLEKGTVGGFAVSGRSPTKLGFKNYFNVSGDNTPIIIDPSEAKVVWFPKKEAFWVGRVLIEDPDSVGFNSFAVGYEAIAKGNYSQSLGYQTRARGNFSTAIGYKTQANGVGCFAVGGEERNATGVVTGKHTIASGIASFALGLGAYANGIANTSIGLRSNATGAFASTAFGVFAQASATRATAIGYGSVASAEQSLAIGVSDTASAYNSVAMGVGSKATGIASVALGSFVESNSNGSFVVGQLNRTYAVNSGWNSIEPLFVIGNGYLNPLFPGDLSQAIHQNALTILKNGNMGIGVDNPKRTIHIRDVMLLTPIVNPQITNPLYEPQEGEIYYDINEHKLKVFDGATWQSCW